MLLARDCDPRIPAQSLIQKLWDYQFEIPGILELKKILNMNIFYFLQVFRVTVANRVERPTFYCARNLTLLSVILLILQSNIYIILSQ